MLKIVHIITGLQYGGAEKLLYLTCMYLQSYDVDIKVVYFDPVAPMKPYLEKLGIPCSNIKRSFCGFWSLVTFLRREQFDVIHTHLIHADLIGRCAALISGKHRKVFTTVHGTEWFRQENKLVPRLVRWLDRSLSRPSKHSVIAISKSVRNLLIRKEKIDSKKITLLYNAVEVGSSNQRCSRDLTKLLYVGRLSPEKNISTLIHALKIIKNRNTTLTLVGDGEEREKLEKLVLQLDLKNRVTFLKGRFDVNAVYQKHDALVLPSRHEGLGIVILEAFSHNMPVIGSNVEGVAELLSDGRGILFECGNSSDLAKKITELQADKSKQDLLAKLGYDYVSKNHNIENYAAQLFKLYNGSKAK